MNRGQAVNLGGKRTGAGRTIYAFYVVLVALLTSAAIGTLILLAVYLIWS